MLFIVCHNNSTLVSCYVIFSCHSIIVFLVTVNLSLIVCLSVCIFVFISVSVSLSLCVIVSLRFSVYMCFCLYVYLSVCLSLSLSLSLSLPFLNNFICLSASLLHCLKLLLSTSLSHSLHLFLSNFLPLLSALSRKTHKQLYFPFVPIKSRESTPHVATQRGHVGSKYYRIVSSDGHCG